ncbi:peptidoglycan recognition protein [Streptomyces sp. NPDC051940]|uniref:peptidoglycan recognition protein family protein n=1 Tax=Streptomyces sp. NPDC051940 TaxID=3155675 RepID=UPI003425EA95
MRADSSPQGIRRLRPPTVRELSVLAVGVGVLLCAGDRVPTGDPPGPPPAARAGPVEPAVPRPVIVPRERWLDGEVRAQPKAKYAQRVVAVIVHHTDSPNTYDCADAPFLIRNLRTGHTGYQGWDDIGYNFLIDRCGTIYEGRAGGTDRPVVGAHSQGFNRGTAGVAVLGTFTAGNEVPQAVENALARLVAWKLSLSHTDPSSTVRLVSTNDNARYPAGTAATLPALAGHEDGYQTSCPGRALYERLPFIRRAASRIQQEAALAHRPVKEAAHPRGPVKEAAAGVSGPPRGAPPPPPAHR